MEKKYTYGIAVVFFIVILTIIMVMIFRKKDKEDTTPKLTSTSNNLLSSTSQVPLGGNNNMLISDGAGNISSIGFPLGTIIMWTPEPDETTPPPGWAICDGSTVRIRTAKGNETDFTLPDLRGRFPIGVNGGNITNVTTGYSFSLTPISSLSTYSVGIKGGEEKHTLTESEMPKHSHSVEVTCYGSDQRDGWDTDYRIVSSGGDVCSTNNGNRKFTESLGGAASTPVGVGVPHNNMPPFCAVYFIIKLA